MMMRFLTRDAVGHSLLLLLALSSTVLQRSAERNLSLHYRLASLSSDLRDGADRDSRGAANATSASAARGSEGEELRKRAEELRSEVRDEDERAGDDEAAGEALEERAREEEREEEEDLAGAERDGAAYEADVANATEEERMAERDAAEAEDLASRTAAEVQRLCGRWAIFRSGACRDARAAADAAKRAAAEAAERARSEYDAALGRLRDAAAARDDRAAELKAAEELRARSAGDEEEAEELEARAEEERTKAEEEEREAARYEAESESLLRLGEEEGERAAELRARAGNETGLSRAARRDSDRRGRRAWWDSAVALALAAGVLAVVGWRLLAGFLLPAALRVCAYGFYVRQTVRMAATRSERVRLIRDSLPRRALSFCLLHGAIFLAMMSSFSGVWAKTEEQSARCRGGRILSPSVIWAAARFALIAAAVQCLVLYGGAWLYFALRPPTGTWGAWDAGGAGDAAAGRARAGAAKDAAAVALSLYAPTLLLFALEVLIVWVAFGASPFRSGLVSEPHTILYCTLVVVGAALYLRCFGPNPSGWEFWPRPSGASMSRTSSTDRLYDRIDEVAHDLSLEADALLRVFEEADAESRSTARGPPPSVFKGSPRGPSLETDSLLGGGEGEGEGETGPSGRPSYVPDGDDEEGDGDMDAVTLSKGSAVDSSLAWGADGTGSSSYFDPVAVGLDVTPHVRFLELPLALLVALCMASVAGWCWPRLRELGPAFADPDGGGAPVEGWRLPLFAVVAALAFFASLFAASGRNLRHILGSGSTVSLAV